VKEAPASRRGQLGAAAVERVRLCGPVFSALCHFRFAAGKAVGLVARDVKQSMSVVEPSRKSVGKEAPASRRGQLGAAAVERVRLCGPVFSALCHFRFAAGKAVGLVARDVKQSMSVVEPSRKSVGKQAPASRRGQLGAAAVERVRLRWPVSSACPSSR
jgi:hypothetical protein